MVPIKYVWLNLGAVPLKPPYSAYHNLSRHNGFTGCIYGLKVNNKATSIFNDAEDSFRVTECKSLACLSSPCKNGAVCVEEEDSQDHESTNWKCKCQFGYLGLTCERSICDVNPCRNGGTCVTFPQSGYLCLCPLGKHGHLCEHGEYYTHNQKLYH